MFAKLVTLTVLLICLAGTLMLLRQHRLELAHYTSQAHARMEQARRDIWDAQASAAMLLTPRSLERRLQAAGIVLEPSVPEAEAAALPWPLGARTDD